MKTCKGCGREYGRGDLPHQQTFNRSRFCGMECFRAWQHKGESYVIWVHGMEWALLVLPGGVVSKISPEDVAFVESRCWHVDSPGYVACGEGGLHAMLVKTPRGKVTDHINRDRMDNRRENLRVVPGTVNARNTGPFRNNTSGAKGVRYRNGARGETWTAFIWSQGRQVYLGVYRTLDEAVAVRSAAERQLWGFSHNETNCRFCGTPSRGGDCGCDVSPQQAAAYIARRLA